MKKSILLTAVVAAAALVVTGCTHVNTSDGASGVPQIKSDHPHYAATFNHKNTRVAGHSQINVLFGFIAWGADGFADNSALSFFSFFPSAGNIAKSAAVYDACKRSKADVLLGTRYTMTTTSYVVFSQVKCDVKGYPATMSGVIKKKPYAVGNKVVWLSEKPVAVK